MHTMKIKKVRTGMRSCHGSGGGVRAAQLALCAVLLAAGAGAQSAANWRIDTIAGSLEVRDNGPAVDAWLRRASGVAMDHAGNLYIADRDSHRVRKVDPSGVITTVAGTGEREPHFGGDGDGGPATEARLNFPYDVAVDGNGNLYIADRDNHQVRKVDPSSVITTIAGTGERGFDGDGGPATEARLNLPCGVVVDGAGNLYIVDSFNHRIRKVDTSGVITTVAGSEERGFGGDGGPAAEARLRVPFSVAVDGAGNLYIVDSFNHRIRKVDTSGVITTVAGTGEPGYGRDGGQATEARLASPRGVAVDPQATSSSPIRVPTASARWTPLGSSAPWLERERGASAGTAALPSRPGYSPPLALRWTTWATCSSPMGTTGSAG